MNYEKRNDDMLTVFYSLLHFIVDGVCAFAMFGKFVGAQGGYEFFLVYNFCAFALQMPFGTLLDMFAEKSRERISFYSAVFGVVLTFIGAFTHPIVLGMGNALFHVGAGVDVIQEDHAHGWRGQALGIFVAPGALGLVLGTLFAKQNGTVSWGIVLGIAGVASVFSVIALYRAFSKESTYRLTVQVVGDLQETKEGSKGFVFVTLGCFLVVILRSYVGMAVSFSWKTTFLLSICSVLAVVLGKMAGGIFSVRFGMKKTIVLSLLLSLVCYLLSDVAIFGIGALFFFNMTMPITLYLLVCKWNSMPGFSFGLLTFGLFLGFLPSYFGLEIPLAGELLGSLGSLISMMVLLVFCLPKGEKN